MTELSRGARLDAPQPSVSETHASEAHRRRRGFRWGLVIPAVLLVGLVLWLVFHPKKNDKDNDKNQVVRVSVAKVTPASVPLSVNALGQAQAWQAVLVKAQVTGKLLQIPVKEGTDVKQGQLIAQIDPAPFQAQLTEAKGLLAKDQATLDNARIDLKRYQQLVNEDSIARQQADTQASLVHQLEGTIEQDKGAVQAAQVNLDWTRITAPISGRIGVRLVDAGNLIAANDPTGIVSINQITPIGVTFTVPQGDFQRLAAASDGFRKTLPVKAFSQETNQLLATGQLVVVDNHVDSNTATVALKARFDNTGHTLWPGQFVNVVLTLETLQDVLTIPNTAVNEGPNGPFAFVVAPHNKVTERPIAIQTTQGATAVLKSGLKAGEQVVTDGQLTLAEDSTICVAGQKTPCPTGGDKGGKGGGAKTKKPAS